MNLPYQHFSSTHPLNNPIYHALSASGQEVLLKHTISTLFMHSFMRNVPYPILTHVVVDTFQTAQEKISLALLDRDAAVDRLEKVPIPS